MLTQDFAEVIPKGTPIVKIPCHSGCTCDGSQIPPGTPGIISLDPDFYRAGMTESNSYYRCTWSTKPPKRSWWTYRHGFELDSQGFPDISYLEDV